VNPGHGDALDGIATRVFDHETGRRRIAPLLRRFDAVMGSVLADDPGGEGWLTARLDWALCDAPVMDPGMGGSMADTWLRRVLAGEVPEVTLEPGWDRLAAHHVGIFEVWPHPRGAFLRDVLRGLSLPLNEPSGLQPDRSGPAGLWDVRVVLEGGAATLCRPPLDVPLRVLPLLREAMRQRFTVGRKPLDLLEVRRAWLQCYRQPRLSPRLAFARLLPPGPQAPTVRWWNPDVRRP